MIMEAIFQNNVPYWNKIIHTHKKLFIFFAKQIFQEPQVIQPCTAKSRKLNQMKNKIPLFFWVFVSPPPLAIEVGNFPFAKWLLNCFYHSDPVLLRYRIFLSCPFFFFFFFQKQQKKKISFQSGFIYTIYATKKNKNK